MDKSLQHSPDTARPFIAIAFIIAMLSMALSPHAALAGVYKCKDAKGKITYSDSPCQTQATQQTVDKSIQFENSAAGRQAAAANRSEAERRKIQAKINECNSAVGEYLDMLGARASKGALTRQEKDVTAICGRNELLARGIVKPAPPPAPVVINQGGTPSPPPSQFCKVKPNGTLFCF